MFVKGIEEENLSTIRNGPMKDNPFLKSLELRRLPKKSGEARLLSGVIDYSLLFNNSKQVFKPRRAKKIKRDNDDMSIEFIQTFSTSHLEKAINDLEYDKHYPLNEFYQYNGSLSKPPCDENGTYVIKREPVYAPFNQILVNF